MAHSKAFRQKREKNVIFDDIFKCSLIEHNKDWKQLFNDMARNICPKGISIMDGTIKCNNSKKGSISYCFSDKTPENNINNIKEMLENYVNIDKNIVNNYFDKVKENTNTIIEWKKIRRKNIKEVLLQNYSIKLATENSLCSKQVYKHLYNALFINKTHNSNDITVSKGIITNICDFKIENGLIINNREEVKEIEKNKKKSNINILHMLWEHYILDCRIKDDF
jgi:hypothetical protein